ncbi:MAG: FAD:protein FMN transferase, partial [Flavobacteriaceae bacterium]|nr:FAD:protein FMN transferase [Flavobacteriaceae bacterium]
MKVYYIILIALFVSCTSTEKQELYTTTGNAFGTTFSIQMYSEKEMNIEKGIDSVIYKVNKSVSTYMPKSDISKINNGDSTIVVDAIFKEVFRISEIVYTNSEGYFDPTIGVLRNAYGFGDVQPVEKIDATVLDSLRNFVGFKKVSLLKDGTIHKDYPEIYFDFNAVAKG